MRDYIPDDEFQSVGEPFDDDVGAAISRPGTLRVPLPGRAIKKFRLRRCDTLQHRAGG